MLDRFRPSALSLLRIMSGLLFLEHGLKKIVDFPPTALQTAAAHVAHAMPPEIVAAGYIEIIGGLLITFGLFTRVASFICSGEMAFAYFLGHAPDGVYPLINKGDAAILLCFIFFYLVFSGPGHFSLDTLLISRRPAS
jgi:putative oxidoreductase